MAENRLTLWPGSVPDDTRLSATFDHSNVPSKPVTPGGRISVGDGATPTETLIARRGARYDGSDATRGR
jgi:hypothetical protein